LGVVLPAVGLDRVDVPVPPVLRLLESPGVRPDANGQALLTYLHVALAGRDIEAPPGGAAHGMKVAQAGERGEAELQPAGGVGRFDGVSNPDDVALPQELHALGH